LQETRIEPDVFVAGGKEHPIARRQREIREHLRAPVAQVLDVKRYEEVGILREVPGPEIPATCSCLRWVAQSM